MKYLWNGPPTVAEIWPDPMPEGEEATAAPLFSGALVPGHVIAADLPSDHPQVTGWLAFGLIAPSSVTPIAASKARDKESPNG